MEDTLQVVFRPARNGAGVICRLPNGKIAFPSRYHWKAPLPQPFEIWAVLPCGETASVAYVKPIRRLAEAPFRDTRAGRFGNSLLWRLGSFLAALVGLARRPQRSALPSTDQPRDAIPGRSRPEMEH